MTAPDGYRLVDIPEARIPEAVNVDSLAFMAEWSDEDRAVYESIMPRARARAAEVTDASRGTVGALGGAYSAYDMEIAVPGGALGAPRRLPCAGLTWVGVHPSHRRRGILRSMIADHFSVSVRDGYPVSALWAAETEIYQRFGYGQAAQQAAVTLRRRADLRPVAGSDALTVRIERADQSVHLDTVLAVLAHDARPGTVVPPAGEGHTTLFADTEDERDDHEKWLLAIVEDAHAPVGFAFFRRKGDWSDGDLPAGKVQVEMHHVHSAAAAHRLWTTLLDLDLTDTVTVSHMPLDDPLLSLLADPRAARQTVRDNLWLRILDVPAALAGRAYAADGEFGVVVRDALLPANDATWRLAIAGGEATVERWERDVAPDVSLGIQELSAAYLGGASLTALAAAGLVEETTPGAVERLTRAMASAQAPLTSWDF